jgi:dCTP deaminase
MKNHAVCARRAARPTYATAEEIKAFEQNPPPGRSLLSRPAILYHLEQGNILIAPFNAQNVGANSVDVTLGEHIYHEAPACDTGRRLLNPFDYQEVKANWQPEEPINAGEYVAKHGALKGVSKSDRLFIVKPGVMYLAHTNEFIGGRNCISTNMHARSSVGRNGIAVCKCADQGGVGFFNRWTMEITFHLNRPLLLVVGMRIAQISFNLVDPVGDDNYASSGGKYQSSSDYREVMRSWTPLMILPRLDRDRETGNGFHPRKPLLVTG